mmetsp:Transcript_10557/g.28080  ORF Transcript_10557/g.28080 Transcript_10557/m.28080 type:complete len:357 (+) Transcript_10557:31-1101(+)
MASGSGERDEGGAREAERAFESYAFAADERFERFRRSADLVSGGGVDAETAIRRAFFRKYVDKRLPAARTREAPPQSVPQQSAPQQSAPQQAPRRSGVTAAGSSRSSGAQTASTPVSTAQDAIAPLHPRVLDVLRFLSKPQMRVFFSAFILLTALLSVLGVLGDPDLMFSKAHVAAMITYAIGLLAKTGAPKVSMEYARRAMRTDELAYLYFSFTMRSAPVALRLSLVPIVTFATYTLLDAARSVLPPAAHTHAAVESAYSSAGQRRADVLYFVASCELLLPLAMACYLFSTPRIVLSIFGYVQFLRLRAALSPFMRRAMAAADSQTHAVVAQVAPSLLPHLSRARAALSSLALRV